MTQQELAERAKLSVEAVSTLERGARTRPYRETVALLGRALRLSPEQESLLTGAIGVAHPSLQRERSEALNASLLRLVGPDTEAVSNNLPQPLTSFVGRQAEFGEIAALVRDHMLVTVVGAGGVGKTRTAVETSRDLLVGFPDGAWLVDLAPLADRTLVASTVLSALRLPSTTAPALDVVVAYLKPRRLLLILDNCEHLMTGAREVVAGIVQACPDVRLLATSREALDVPGERIYRLPSLAVPPDSCRTAREALKYGVVTLFVDRASAVNPGFTLTDDDTTAVAEICRRLDGIPLAIEMAAARVKVLAPRQIAERLDRRFRLLTGRDPRALPRHQTMKALIDWSFDLLAPREQRFFEVLSVFAGGCTLEAATAVCATDGEDDIEVVHLLESLVTKSLVVAELVGDQQRYRLFESTRQYVSEKLLAIGEQEQTAGRHALFYVESAERLERAWNTMPDRESLPQAQEELENWRAVLEWTLANRNDVVLGQRLAASRNVMWHGFPPVEARRWVRAALDLVDQGTPRALAARLDHAEADGAQGFGEWQTCLAASERALAQYRQLDDIPGSVRAEGLVCAALGVLGRSAETLPRLRQALTTARELGDRLLTADLLHTVGLACNFGGDLAGARSNLTEALESAKLAGAEVLGASIAGSLADVEYDAGDADTALRHMLGVLETYTTLKYSTVRGMTITLSCLGLYLVTLGRYEEARARAGAALELGHGGGMVTVVAGSLQVLAIVHVLNRRTGPRAPVDHAAAARLFGFVDARFAALGISEVYPAPRGYDRACAVLRETIVPDELMRLTTEGAAMSEDEAIDLAQSLT